MTYTEQLNYNSNKVKVTLNNTLDDYLLYTLAQSLLLCEIFF